MIEKIISLCDSGINPIFCILCPSPFPKSHRNRSHIMPASSEIPFVTFWMQPNLYTLVSITICRQQIHEQGIIPPPAVNISSFIFGLTTNSMTPIIEHTTSAVLKFCVTIRAMIGTVGRTITILSLNVRIL